MARISLNAEKRENTGNKSAIRTMRQLGTVPGVVYHKGDASLAIQLSDKALLEILHTQAGRNALIDLKVSGEKAAKQRTVVVKALQQEPVSGRLLHVDFHQISLTEKIKVRVPIVEKGESIGVKNEGGILEAPLRELEIECLPTDIPEHVEVDISNLALNQSIHVRDLVLPPALKILSDSDMVIVQVKLPTVEKPAEAVEEAKEPEVISEKKKEEEAGEAPAAKGEEPKKEKSEKAEAPKK